MRIRSRRAIENNDIDYLCMLMGENKLNTLRNIGKKDIKELEDYLMDYKRSIQAFYEKIGN